MQHHRFSHKSLDKLATCDERLERLAHLALKYSKYDFGITEGVRTIERQREVYNSGKSTTMNSRHLPNENGDSEALDILIYVNGSSTWKPEYYRKVAEAFYRAAFELSIPIEWGGHWESIFDGPHYELAKWSK